MRICAVALLNALTSEAMLARVGVRRKQLHCIFSSLIPFFLSVSFLRLYLLVDIRFRLIFPVL